MLSLSISMFNSLTYNECGFIDLSGEYGCWLALRHARNRMYQLWLVMRKSREGCSVSCKEPLDVKIV